MADLFYLSLYLSLVFFLLILFFWIVLDSYRLKISPMPSNLATLKVVKSIMEEYPELKTIIDLGSGFGVSTFYFCRAFPNKKVISIEGSLPIAFMQKIFLMPFSFSNLKSIYGNFFQRSEIKSCCYFAYLYPDSKDELLNYFIQNCPKGSVLIAAAFALNLKEEKKVVVNDLFRTHVYVYRN
jgi:trans-aconitate methyltransferase